MLVGHTITYVCGSLILAVETLRHMMRGVYNLPGICLKLFGLLQLLLAISLLSYDPSTAIGARVWA